MPGHDPLGVHVEVGSGSSGGFGEIADIAKTLHLLDFVETRGRDSCRFWAWS
jgi:hypothetical protein